MVDEDGPAPAPDPLEGAGAFYRSLKTAKAPPVQTLEEQNPELMAEFISGPFVENADGTIDCTLHHPIAGNIPFTASAQDVEPHGRAAHAYILTQLGD